MVELEGRKTYAGPCGSYAGYEDEVAIAPFGRHPTKVEELVQDLRVLLRTGVNGLDGSKHPVGMNTAVWVSTEDAASGEQVDRVYFDGSAVVIKTVVENVGPSR